MGKFTADVVLCLSSRRIDLTSSSSKALQHPILIMRIKNDLLTEFAWNKSPKTIPWQSRLTPHVTTPYQTEMLEWNTREIDKEDHSLKGHTFAMHYQGEHPELQWSMAFAPEAENQPNPHIKPWQHSQAPASRIMIMIQGLRNFCNGREL